MTEDGPVMADVLLDGVLAKDHPMPLRRPYRVPSPWLVLSPRGLDPARIRAGCGPSRTARLLPRDKHKTTKVHYCHGAFPLYPTKHSCHR